jgi:hypothetical protein
LLGPAQRIEKYIKAKVQVVQVAGEALKNLISRLCVLVTVVDRGLQRLICYVTDFIGKEIIDFRESHGAV